MEETFDIHGNHHLQDSEREYENTLRPLTFGGFSGQEKVTENLKIFVSAARMRGESPDHVLLHDPPGWERPHFRTSLPMNWELASKSLPAGTRQTG